MTASTRLFQFAAAVFVLNVIATAVAVAVNWPAQFGGVGTDAGDEFLLRGTAISAPLLPAVLLLVVALLARRPGAAAWVAVIAAYVTAVLVFVGGLGELVAEPTDDTPKAVLVTAGIVWAVVAIAFALLATAVIAERRRHDSPS